ncbi:D-sedoheptulose 7-phosphate isomerase [Bradyrhizobium sp.]|uniref:D-sedoheptulose 7-phosphate isomerase n=1 Tax=Bradyrhizobium sp. TaxID=376 RepID=UPI002391DB5D|nr:D-sedoheptulose 7-phosphate isomerase [Bradyrhizobium sp.]MDE2379199.1 D-sedoheptulose 7-phosphate isomerase [Bradyrhizobium sp.]
MSEQSKGPIGRHLDQSLAALHRATKDPALCAVADAIADAMVRALRAGGKILIIGNGGSAGDAQHIAAELAGRYKKERPALAAIALTTDTSALTAISNDYGFDRVFVRQIEALGRAGDVLLALSTSGRSPNILEALKFARERGLVTIGFTGSKGEAMRPLCDHLMMAPTDDTPIIQQIYLTFGHAICDAVEQVMAGEPPR